MHNVGSRANLGSFYISISISIYPVLGLFEAGSTRDRMPGMEQLEMEDRINAFRRLVLHKSSMPI